MQGWLRKRLGKLLNTVIEVSYDCEIFLIVGIAAIVSPNPAQLIDSAITIT